MAAREPAVGPPTIERRDLERVLDAGPGALLQHVPLLPVMSEGERRRFVGYRIGAVFDNSPTVLRYGVRPGDLLHSVNGQTIATPDQMMRVFAGLRTATEVQVSVVREGQRLDLRWPVIESPRGAKPRPATAGQSGP